MQNENRIRLNKDSHTFECEYRGAFNDLDFTIVHKKYNSIGNDPVEILEILWDNIVPKRDNLAMIEQGIKEMFKKKVKK